MLNHTKIITNPIFKPLCIKIKVQIDIFDYIQCIIKISLLNLYIVTVISSWLFKKQLINTTYFAAPDFYFVVIPVFLR